MWHSYRLLLGAQNKQVRHGQETGRFSVQPVVILLQLNREGGGQAEQLLQKYFCGARCASANCVCLEPRTCLALSNPPSCRLFSPAPTLACLAPSPMPPSPPLRHHRPTGGARSPQ